MDVRALEQTMVMTMYAPDGSAESVTRTHIAVDFENHRAAVTIFTDDAEGAPDLGGTSIRMVYLDGEGRMLMLDTGMALPLPMEQAEVFSWMFEQPQAQDGLLDEYEPLSYDGVQFYAGIVEGEQVTVRSHIDAPGVDIGPESRLLFDEAGRHIATINDAPGVGTLLVIHDEPGSAELAGFQSSTTYLLEDGQAVPFLCMHLEDIRLNEPLDESLFELGAVPEEAADATRIDYQDQAVVLSDHSAVAVVEFMEPIDDGITYRYRLLVHGTGEESTGEGEVFERYHRESREDGSGYQLTDIGGKLHIVAGPLWAEWSMGDPYSGWIYPGAGPARVVVTVVSRDLFETLDLFGY